MEIIRVTKENLACEHICCAISNENDCQVASKKAWLSARFSDGLVFLKGNVRGKCFIEYIPAEKAWAPVNAEGYNYIDCLWVAGQFKGHGYSTVLLDACIEDSKQKGKCGLVSLSSDKKRGFFADKGYLLHKGFIEADSAPPFFKLMYLPFDKDAKVPCFNEYVKHAKVYKEGFTLYYTNQCPFTAKYVPLLQQTAKDKGAPLHVVHIESCLDAQKAPTPFTTFTLYYNGEVVTNEILSQQKFEKIIEEKCNSK